MITVSAFACALARLFSTRPATDVWLPSPWTQTSSETRSPPLLPWDSQSRGGSGLPPPPPMLQPFGDRPRGCDRPPWGIPLGSSPLRADGGGLSWKAGAGGGRCPAPAAVPARGVQIWAQHREPGGFLGYQPQPGPNGLYGGIPLV